MKNHLKRIAAPRTWVLDRHERTYTLRPNSGSHTLESGLALGFILRDILKLGATTHEVRKILINTEVLVDGKRTKDYRFMVGFFDVLSIPELKKHYRVIFDRKGRLTIIEIPATESNVKVSKVVGKSLICGGKVQLHLYDGKNILSDVTVKVGDSILVSLPDLKVKEVFPLNVGSAVFLAQGKHSGDMGTVKELKPEEAIYTSSKGDVATARSYLFVVGSKKPIITLQQ